MKSMIMGVVLSTVALGVAAEDFGTVKGIPADAMSVGEMQMVEGKGLLPTINAEVQDSLAAGVQVNDLNVAGLVGLGELGVGVANNLGASVGVGD